MKDIILAMQEHLQQEVTTLCMCISVVRQDGKAFYFTDHDTPVVVEGQTHYPQWGFSRTSVLSTLQLEIDNLQIAGALIASSTLNPLAVSREEIEAGLFDFANVYVYAVNYEDPTMGKIAIRRGWVGEIESNEDGSYKAEVRGLSQVYAYKIGNAYSPNCRTDLGSSLCKVVLDAQPWQANTIYAAGQRVLGVIDAALDWINLNLTNPDFEFPITGDPGLQVTGWTTYGDTTYGRWTEEAELRGLHSQSGEFFVGQTMVPGFTSGVLGITQDVDLVSQGVTEVNLDSGLCRMNFTVQAAAIDGSSYRVKAFARDLDGNLLATICDTGWKSSTGGRFVPTAFLNVLLPPGTRSIRLDLSGSKKSTITNGACFDDVQVAINNPGGTAGNASQYGGVAFLCTQTGTSGATAPAWSNLLGATFSDNTTAWVCVQTLKSEGVVTTVISPKMFQSDSLDQGAGWFDAGVLTWETGANAGRSSELRSWDGLNLQLLLRPFYPMQPGDRFVAYPGCQKSVGDCKGKFNNLINFRGEPKVPGQDQFITTPDSHTD